MHHLVRTASLLSLTTLFSIAHADDTKHCVGSLQSGIYDYFKSSSNIGSNSVAQKDFCEVYKKYNSDKISGNAAATYGAFDGSASFSRDQMESIGKMVCSADYSSQAASQILQTSSAIISPTAMASYNKCLELATKRGLKIDYSPSMDDAGNFTISASWITSFNGQPKITGISVSPGSKSISCTGTLWQAGQQAKKGAPVLLDKTLSMLCTRQVSNTATLKGGKPVLAQAATVLIETEADGITFHLPAIKPGPAVDDLAEIRKFLVPIGSYVFMDRACPSRGYQDVTETFDGRFLKVDRTVVDAPKVINSDGSHDHGSWAHSHSVSGTTAPHPRIDGHIQKRGDREADASHYGHTHDFAAQSSNAGGQISGGGHTHSSIGLRVCKRTP